jgi:tetratricopeptide (TPR) repeat protein
MESGDTHVSESAPTRPHFIAYSNLGTAYFYLKRYAEAAKMFERAAELSPNQQVVLGNLADAYRWSGQTKKAIATYDRAIALAYKELEVNPRAANSLQSLALYYAKKGNTVEALDLITQALAIDPNNVQFIYGEAEVRAFAGQPQGALEALRYAFERGYPPDEAMIDPELSILHSSPEFERLIRGVKSKKI